MIFPTLSCITLQSRKCLIDLTFYLGCFKACHFLSVDYFGLQQNAKNNVFLSFAGQLGASPVQNLLKSVLFFLSDSPHGSTQSTGFSLFLL